MALETLLANVPQTRTVKSNSLELTPSNTPQLSPATTPANKKNRLPIGTYLHSFQAFLFLLLCFSNEFITLLNDMQPLVISWCADYPNSKQELEDQNVIFCLIWGKVNKLSWGS